MPIRKLSQQEIEDREASKPLRSTRRSDGYVAWSPYWSLKKQPWTGGQPRATTLQEAYNKLSPEGKASFNEAQKGILQILLEDRLTSPEEEDVNPHEYGTREFDVFSDSWIPQGIQTDDLKDMVFERLGVRVYNTDIDNLHYGGAIQFVEPVQWTDARSRREEEYKEGLTPHEKEQEAYNLHLVRKQRLEDIKAKSQKRRDLYGK